MDPHSLEPEAEEERDETFDLLEGVARGDRAASELLFSIHRKRLIRALRSYVSADLRHKLDEEELVQETFRKALGKLDRFEWRGKGAFLAWLVRMALNQLRDELRKPEHRDPRGSARRPIPEDDGDGVGLLDEVVDADIETPSMVVSGREKHELLERALDELDAEDRALIVNRKILGQDYQSLAEDMGLSQSGVRARVARILERMKDWIEAHQ